ncbi:MAG: hypothetical protein Q7S62_03460 [bacterium]|nr:hypothetical protein [bacterium]
MRQAFFLLFIFFFLAFLQTSFLAHFALQGFVIPLVIIGVSILGIVAQTSFAGLLGVFAGGLVLDVFSQHFFGYWTLIMVLVFCAVSFFIHTYVRFPFLKRN